MKVVIISDTHTQHEGLGTLSGDVLIHCGDIGLGTRPAWQEVQRLDAWFEQQAFKWILCTGGNHDSALEEAAARGSTTFRNATYLQDKEVVLDGVKFYGAPWVPELEGWAFYQGGTSLRGRWAMIPANTDVLITHSPPYGILDANSAGRRCGCKDLRDRIDGLRLRLHCFGHIHASAGTMKVGDTMYVNASMVDRTYKIVRRPVQVEL